ncbi:MAG: hypothetical protein KF744_09190 [Taibaiella sp.]|nr:hypothetical protein [Taibaiella sp.]
MTGLSVGERLVVVNELSSPKLKWLSDDEMHNALIDALKVVKVLTGALLHEGELLKVQVEVLKMFLVTSERYRELTMNEVKHAFYLNHQGEYGEVYKHYNRELNAEYLGCVLNAYMGYKRTLYRRYGAQIKEAAAEQKVVVQPMELEEKDLQAMIQGHYEMWLQGMSEFVFVYMPVWRYLKRIGAAEWTRSGWYEMFHRAVLERMRYAKSYYKAKSVSERYERMALVKVYDEYKDTGYMPKDEWMALVTLMRKTVYLEFFEALSMYGVRHIFRIAEYDSYSGIKS